MTTLDPVVQRRVTEAHTAAYHHLAGVGRLVEAAAAHEGADDRSGVHATLQRQALREAGRELHALLVVLREAKAARRRAAELAGGQPTRLSEPRR